MKLSTVLTACDEKYARFVPLFIKAWQKFYPDVAIKIIFIGTIPERFSSIRHYLEEYTPPPGLPTAYCAQTIRLLWPALLGNPDGVLITDIDMIPANSTYFTENIGSLPNDLFVNYRQGDGLYDHIYMCYNVAPSSIWAEMFHITSREDVDTFLEKNFNKEYDSEHGGNGWFTDQELFFKYFMQWKDFGGPNSFIFLTDNDTKFERIDYFVFIYKKCILNEYLNTKKYADCHLYAHMCRLSEEELTDLL